MENPGIADCHIKLFHLVGIISESQLKTPVKAYHNFDKRMPMQRKIRWNAGIRNINHKSVIKAQILIIFTKNHLLLLCIIM